MRWRGCRPTSSPQFRNEFRHVAAYFDACQVSAALSEGRVSDDVRRQAYYDALARATSRLHKLVEDLLDFAKMESDVMPYRMESIDLAALTARVVSDFRKRDAGPRVHTS